MDEGEYSQLRSCGIRLQQTHPDKPGYFKIPTKNTDYPLRKYFDKERERETDLVNIWSSIDTQTIEPDEALADPAEESEIVVEEEFEGEGEEDTIVVCERCFSLKNHGKLKNLNAEKLVPRFNIERVLKPKIVKQKGKRVVVVCVVDLTDFDASLPLEELRALFPPTSSLPDFLDFIFVGNKVDLLRKTLTPRALEIWVRTRLNERQLPFAKNVHLVSCLSMIGIRKLMTTLRKEIVLKTDCYVIGVQNAGKSSLLNALRQLVDDGKANSVTTASLPGTTLGLVQVSGFPLSKSCRVFDTPGIEKRDQITTRLSLDELKLVQPRRMLKPRTYRFGMESSLLIGGIVRVDITSCPGTTLYVTPWVSDAIVCYLGKKDGIQEKLKKHRGRALQPPVGNDLSTESAQELVPQSVSVNGDSWKRSSIDICIAGLGWLAVGCVGEAEFTIWTLAGIRVTTRPSMLNQYSAVFQKTGFSHSVKYHGVRSK